MRAESSECRGEVRVLGPSARAASTSLRFVSDFDDGTSTVACTGASARGAAHGDDEAGGVREYPVVVIGFYPNEPVRRQRKNEVTVDSDARTRYR